MSYPPTHSKSIPSSLAIQRPINTKSRGLLNLLYINEDISKWLPKSAFLFHCLILSHSMQLQSIMVRATGSVLNEECFSSPLLWWRSTHWSRPLCTSLQKSWSLETAKDKSSAPGSHAPTETKTQTTTHQFPSVLFSCFEQGSSCVSNVRSQLRKVFWKSLVLFQRLSFSSSRRGWSVKYFQCR